MEIQSDHWTEAILENIPHGVIVTDNRGIVIYWNCAAEKSLGYKKDEITGQPVTILFKDKNDRISGALSGKERRDLHLQWKYNLVHKDGKSISIDLVARRLEDNYLMLSFSDSDTNIEEGEKYKYTIAETIFTSSSNAFITASEDGIIRTVNRAASRMFGYDDGELIGENLKILMPFPFSVNYKKNLRRYMVNSEMNAYDFSRDITGLRKDKSMFPLELAVSEVIIEEERIYVGIIRDLTARQTLERRLVEISNEERRRIGRDLHDGLGQMLTGIRMLSENLARKMDANGLPGAEEVQEIASMIREADELARSLSRDMVHVDIEKKGLIIALKELCLKTTRMTGINCELDDNGFADIENQTTGLNLYRIVQEAINNAVKHGNPKNIKVRLTQSSYYISLTIDDDGCGFDVNKPIEHGTGLQTMKHRAGVIGGVIEFLNTDEGITRVRCIIPIMNDSMN